MDHVLLPYEAPREAMAPIDDRAKRVDEPAAFSYRSEAFAEDLIVHRGPERAATRRLPLAGLLLAAPLGMALVGAVLALFEHVA